MLRERYELISESSCDQQECLSKLLSYVFSDQYIFIDKTFRNMVSADHKGYIHVDQLVKNQLITNFFKNNSVDNHNQKHFYLRGAAESRCPELHYSLARIRRIVPFNIKKFKIMRPISIQRIQTALSIEDVRDYFGQHVFSLNQAIRKTAKEDVVIYSECYREQMENIKNRDPPFTILTFQQLYRQFDLSQRLSERKLLNLHKPIQPPKFRFSANQRGKKSKGIDQDFDLYRQEHRRMMRGPEKDNNNDYYKLGREPNPEFNGLLGELIEEDDMRRR